MCGIAGILGQAWGISQLKAMQQVQQHRGPDAEGIYLDRQKMCGLAHNRLSIIDLSDAGRQPIESADGNYHIVLNGEIYNYLELRRELESEFCFQTRTDTEVLLAAYQKWGTNCLDRLIGMFAFIIWDEKEKTAFVARDRFGVKPLYYARRNEALFLASEIKAIHAAGIACEPNAKTWANYLTFGLTDCGEETFWKEIYSLPAGHFLIWKDGQAKISCWYDIAVKTAGEIDLRSDAEVREEYLELMKESVRLRFRADVPVGINLSGGLDSSTLLGLVHALEKEESSVTAYTFVCDDERYDELPWVRQMLAKTAHPLTVAALKAEDVPNLAVEVQNAQDEPFGGIPTLAYAKLFERARENGTTVLLDGNGMDEQWAGYDYYQSLNGHQPNMVQGVFEKPVRPNCLTPEFRALSKTLEFPSVFPDKLRNTQYRDVRFTKIPRAMRFNDRVSMRSSTELREPFLDHRLFELAFRQPTRRKISDGVGKKMLREIVKELLPVSLVETPKRPLQTPQREWLRGELGAWANDCIEDACRNFAGAWLDEKSVKKEWANFCRGASDNSFYVWQWISLSLNRKISKENSAGDHLKLAQSAWHLF
jgi:asparagine synthase (glutamine-hydrolysing)